MNETDTLYARQEKLNILPPDHVAIVGCGGTGTWVALLLAMVGTLSFELFDRQVLAESNRARLPYSKEAVGTPKNKLLADMIKSLRDHAEVSLWGEANETSLPLLAELKVDYLFDCSDGRATQRTLLQWCEDNHVKYVRVGYNGEHFTVDSTISTFTTDLMDGEDEQGYTIVPSYAPTAILPALLAVDGICRLGRIPTISTTATELIKEGEKL